MRPSEATARAGGLASTKEKVWCGVCDVYTTRQAMAGHRKHTGHGVDNWKPPPPEKKATCEVCGRTLGSAAGLATHQNRTGHGLVGWVPPVRPELLMRVACEVCGMVTTPGGMGLHQKASGHRGKGSVAPGPPKADPRLTPRFRCLGCGHLTGDLDEAEAHRRYFDHLLYSEKGVSEVWYYDLPNEAALFADA